MQNSEELNIYVVADSIIYAESLKRSLELDLEDDVHVETFDNKEKCIDQIYNSDIKPHVVVLDYKLNKKQAGKPQHTHTVDIIKAISPETVVIIFSDEKDMQSAIKALRYGAHDFVLKDSFTHSHIKASVRRCLHPSRL